MRWPIRTWGSIYERALYQLTKLSALADGSHLELMLSRQDFARLVERRDAGDGAIGAIYLIEGAHPLEGDVDKLDLMGVEHVALGFDYDGATAVLFDAGELAVPTVEMLRAGFTEVEIRAVMGENVKRFMLENLPDAGPRDSFRLPGVTRHRFATRSTQLPKPGVVDREQSHGLTGNADRIF